MNIAKFLRKPVLENIWERLFERFPTWGRNITSNMGTEGDIFSKTKQNKTIQNLARWKKLTFSWCYWPFRFSLYLHCMSQAVLALHNKRWCSEGLWNSLTNEGLILDQWKIPPLCCCNSFTTLLGFSARKCWIVICIVIANTIIVAQRRISNHLKYLW